MNGRTAAFVTFGFVYFVVVLLVLPPFCADRVFSPLFRGGPETPARAEREKNEHRKKVAQDHLSSVRPESHLRIFRRKLEGEVEHLVIVMASDARDNSSGALTQLVQQVGAGVREGGVRAALLVCDVGAASVRDEVASLARFYPVFRISEGASRNEEEKKKGDFVKCLLEHGFDRPAEYVTVIRNNALPHKNFLVALDVVVRVKLESRLDLREETGRNRTWAYLDLYEPVSYRHFKFDLRSVSELLFIFTLGSALFYLLALWPASASSVLWLSGCGGVLYTTLALAIGRPYVTETRRTFPSIYTVYPTPEPVGFVGITIPKDNIKYMVEFFNQLQCSIYIPFHKVLYSFSHFMKIDPYYVSPSLLKYIGR